MRRTGALVGVTAAALLALVVPLAIVLVGAVLAPRAWARRARDREVGHRRVLAGGDGVEVRRVVSAAGARLEVRAVPVGKGIYGVVVPVEEGEGGAVVLEGASMEEVVARGVARWDGDARARAEREADGAGGGRAERDALVAWLEGTGVPREAAGRIADRR